MRFGTRTELGRKWSAKGVKLIGEQHIGYDYGYLSVALNPRTGEMKVLILPNMRAASFQVFLDEFSRDLEKRTKLITDGATAHRSGKLRIAEKVELEILPAYSPQLNPVERFFEELRKELKNLVFTVYEEVEKAVIEIVKPYLKAAEVVKKLTCFGWLLN